MFYKKFFSRALISLFAFNALNVLAPACAMESCKKNNIPPFELWCGDYSFNYKVNKNYNNFEKLLNKHQGLINGLHGVNLNVNILKIYDEIFNFIYKNLISDHKVSKENRKFLVCKLNGFGFDFENYDKLEYKNEGSHNKFGFTYPCIYVRQKNSDQYKNIRSSDCPGEQGHLILNITFDLIKLYNVDLQFVKQENLTYNHEKKCYEH